MPNTFKSTLASSSGVALSASAREGLHWSLGLLDHTAKGYPTPPCTRADAYTDLILAESDHTVCEVTFGGISTYRILNALVETLINRPLGTKFGHKPYIRSRAFIWYMVTQKPFTLWSSMWGVEGTKVLHFRSAEHADTYAAHLANNPHVRYWHFRLTSA